MEFLNKLYSINNFGLYLIIAIIILVILFIIIMIFGKNDKKKREIEATTKLQQINAENAFKEENTIMNLDIKDQELQNDTIVIPSLQDMIKMENGEDIKEEPVIQEEEVKEEVVEPANMESSEVEETIVIDESKEEQAFENTAYDTPVLESNEEKPLTFEETSNIDLPQIEIPEVQIENAPQIEIPVVEENISIPEVEIPVYTNTFENNVVVNEPEYTPSDNVSIPEIESVNMEIPVVENPISIAQDISVSETVVENENEEEEIEMPALKSEYTDEDILERTKDIEPIKIDGYNLNDITGEEYTINR